jgi:serine/threonine protein kinase
MSYPGATLNNRYKLEKEVGKGGFATVYQAVDLLLGRTVAVKVLDNTLAADKELMGRFQLEARAVAALDHPNILTVHDFGLLPDSAFLVMPFVPGGALSVQLRARRPTLEEAGQYLEQIASALDSAHKMGIVHRDFKPQNILVRGNGRLVMTDFGFAKMLQDANAEAPTRALGTVHYVAPEQVRGLVSAASDQYSLGVLLYQMVSGGLPFTGTPHDMISGHMQKPPPLLAGQPSMAGIHPFIVDNLDRLFQRVLAKVPANRFPSCEALYQAYREAIVLPAYLSNPDPALSPGPVEREDKTELVDPKYLANPSLAGPGPGLPQETQISSPLPVSPRVPPAPSPPARAGHEPAVVYNPPLKAPIPTPPPTPPRQTPPSGLHRTPVMVRPPRLNVRTEPDQHLNLSFELTGEVLKLGRELDNQLQVPLSTVSRHHATLFRIGPVAPGMTYRIVDNKSRNQLIYRGQIVNERVLEDGDVIEIGKKGYGDYVVFLTYIGPVFR